MISNKYYPQLSSVVDTINLPDELNFIQTGINTLLNDIYLKDYQFVKSNAGDSLSYSLILKVYKRVGIDIPGTGFSILLNPAHLSDPDQNSSDIPVSINIQYEILKYVNNFSLETFASNPLAFFNLFIDILDLLENDFIDHAIILFTSVNTVNEFVDKINSKYQLTGLDMIPYPISTLREDAINEVITSVDNSSVIIDSVHEVVFHSLIENDTSEEITKDNLNRAFTAFIGHDPIGKVLALFLPKICSALSLRPAIEIPRSVLQPMFETNPGEYELEPNETIKTRLDFDIGEFTFSTEGGVGYESEIGVTFDPAYPVAMVGNTGLIIGFSNAKLDLSKNTNIPEATADGRPDDFIGIYVQQAHIYLPKKWFGSQSNPDLFSHNLLIGTGGISGTIGIDGNNALQKTIGNFSIELNHFDITFHQNEVIDSNIDGTLTLPGSFGNCANGPALVAIKAHLGANGDFFVTADSSQGILKFCIPNVLDLTINEFELGNIDDRFYVEVAGKIDFTFQVAGFGDLLPKGVEIKRLRIWDDGALEFVGGVNLLPTTVKLDFGPVAMTITNLSLGSDERNGRKYAYFGFDGGVNVDPGGVDVRANGVKLYFTIDGDTFDAFLRLEGIAIDIILPMGASKETATVLINGFLSMREPPANEPSSASATEYTGGVSITLPKLPLTATAAMRLNPSFPAYFVDLEISLPNAIPLGASGTGIYGLRGLVGHHYPVSKKAAGVAPDASWWQYYKQHTSLPNKEGVYAEKMELGNGLTLGAGVSLATSTDKGKAFSTKLFMLLGLPDTFMLMGQAGILRNRVGLETLSDPPFSALLVISPNSIEANLGVDYNIPEDSGKILQLKGLFELAFFFHNASAWYINIGRDFPEEKRIQGRLFTLFKLYSYLMLSSSGIRAGAGASWKIKKKFGPVSAELKAYADSAGRISFHPKQIGGYVALGGSLKIKVFKFKFGFSIDVALAAEAPQRFIVTGYIKITINLPWPFKDIKLKFELTWTFSNVLEGNPQPLLEDQPSQGNVPTKALNIMSYETFPVHYTHTMPTGFPSLNDIDDHIIPMDSFIDIEMLRGAVAGSNVNGKINGYTGSTDNVVYVPPQQGKSKRVKHDFRINEINLYYHNGTAWTAGYNVYDAATPMLNNVLFQNIGTVNKAIIGNWQVEKPGRYNKIRILGLTPWNYLAQSPGTIMEELGVTNESIFCHHQPKGLICINFECSTGNIPGYLSGYATIVHACWKIIHPGQMRIVEDVIFMIKDYDAVVFPFPGWNFSNGLAVSTNDTLTILLPEPCAIVQMKIFTNTNSVTVKYYNRIVTGTDIYNFPIYADNLVHSDLLTTGQSGVTFDIGVSLLDPITKIEIIPSDCGEGFEGYTCINPTDEANLLFAFLNTLVTNNLLATNFLIYPDQDAIFNGIFHNTILYPNLNTQIPISYHIIEMNNYLLKFLITDYNGYSCTITLQSAYPVQINWAAASGFANLNVSASEIIGEEFNFTIDIIIGGASRPLKGTSCVPIRRCIKECSAFLYELCYQTYDDFQFNLDLQEMNPDPSLNAQSLLDALQNSIQPIWRPDTRYAIEIKGKDVLTDGAPTSPDQRYVIGFRTVGPLGHYHEYNDFYNGLAQDKIQAYEDLEAIEREGEYKLSTLKLYIDLLHSYPDAEGNIIMAKPLYYKNAKLLMFFRHQYIYTMFNTWDDYNGLPKVEIKLDITVKDPAEPISSPGSPTLAPTVDPEWGATNTHYYENPEVTVMNNFLLNGVPCVTLSTTTIFTPISTHVSFPIPDTYLKPQKLYTALFNSKIKRNSDTDFRSREVHKYAFQTSKYESFEKHIHSYIADLGTGTTEEAIYLIERDFSTNGEITEAIQVVTGVLLVDDDLVTFYNEVYDRLIDGALKLAEKIGSDNPPPPLPVTPPLPPATDTEFNIVKDSVSGNIIGVLVRSPEPFNDPRMPRVDFETTLSVDYAVGDPNHGLVIFRPIHSKDRAKVFITNDSMNLPLGILNFVFKYKLWDGLAYAEMEVIDDVNIDLNI